MELEKKDKLRKLSSKVIFLVLSIIIASFLFVVIYQTTILKNTSYEKEIQRARALTSFCEQFRNFIGNLRDLNVFNDQELLNTLKTDLNAGKNYADTKIYLTIPVVSAWMAAEARASELGYKFRVPKDQPRNSKNMPKLGVEKAVVDFLEGRGSLESIEKEGVKIIFPEDKTKAKIIGEIGILHIGEEIIDDAIGKKEKIDAVRFFRSIKLTKDCLSCHGDPLGANDLLGFKKEGWKEGEVHGVFEIIIPLNSMRTSLHKTIRDNIFVAISLVLISIWIFTIFMRRVVENPLNKIVDFAKKIGEGNFTDELKIETKDEIGVLGEYLNIALKNLKETLSQIVNTAKVLSISSDELFSISNLMVSSAQNTQTQTHSVAASTEEITASVSSVASSAKLSSESASYIADMTEKIAVTFKGIAKLAAQTSNKVKIMADSGEKMSISVDTIAAAVEEMTASLKEVANNTVNASNISENANKSAEEINLKMEVLSDASKKIGKFVTLIKDIADQTNMLALNATIEAAGAGEAGKGFAVVANEVKELAKQSSDATEEISEQVENIQKSILSAVNAIESINGIISELANINKTIAYAANEQNSAAGEISKSISDNAVMAKKVSELASEASDLVFEIAKNTDETAHTSSNIAKKVDETALRVKEIAIASNEASIGVDEISKNIQFISEAAKQTKDGADKTNNASKKLSSVSSKIFDMMKKFKI
ncbi:MAG: methyl-accepting chemotaxis protein [Desulfobacterales bacterium]|nr:methyl-accepting chemotaxis protein [Desulfobacterales bacterium]